MHSRCRRSAIAAVLWLFMAGQAFGQADGSNGTLEVAVSGLDSDKGVLRFALFDSEQDFMKQPVRADLVEVADGQGVWVVEDLPFGTYAVLVHHDLDANGKMERHWYGKPKEPTGASNDAPSRFGPPKFRDARFEFESERLTLPITVK